MFEDNYTFRDCIFLHTRTCSRKPSQENWVLLPWLIHDAIGLRCSSQTFSVQLSPQTTRTYLNSWVFSYPSVFAAYFLLKHNTENPVLDLTT